jgi:16S rRNA (guanine527-N7)-methyltransferase
MLRAAAEALGLTLSDTQIAQFLAFRAMLQDWNERVNLTAITDAEGIIVRHFIDSLTCLHACSEELRNRSLRLLDVGSGAGLPGLALAIAQPQWTVVSMEATGKKVRFQEAVIAELGLTNVKVAHGRAEVYAHETSWRGGFAIITARALATLPTLLEWCVPFAQKDGLVIAPKKGDIAAELAQGAQAARILGGAAPEIIRLPEALTELAPDMADGRALVRVRQLASTSPRYPRAGATPVKSPLGQ